MGEVTTLLRRWNDGDRAALDAVLPLVYADLRRVARRSIGSERGGHTLQPTALVHEVFLRLVNARGIVWQDRVHFFAAAAGMLRRILVDHARRRRAAKRGNGAAPAPISVELVGRGAVNAEEVLDLNDALERLEAIDPDRSRVVELRYFAGLTLEETAEALGVSLATVKRDWTAARAWLYRELHG
jgi:RNA polymerase sigma factor (TIGR02999 family)